MEENQLLEDVEFIKKMIENNRRSLIDNGISYISAGVYVVIGSALSIYLQISGMGNMLPYLWLLLLTLLIGFNFFIQKRMAAEKVKKTFAGRVFSAVWIACAIPMLIISVLFFTTNKIPMSAMFSAVSAILGIGYYLTGVINDLKFMKVLAAGWWTSIVISMLWSYFGEEYQLALFFALLILLLEVIPGIIIYNKWKKVYNE